MTSPSNESYGPFAYAYDQALGDTFFRAVKKMLVDALKRYPTSIKTHLDVACGTGYALEFFRQNGFRSVGVDYSVPMLAVAKKRASQLLAGDFRALPLRGTFARITCLYDSLNHMKDRNDLVAAFRNIARLMNPDSLFLFDMNHPDIYPEVWGMKQPYVASGRDYHLEIATKYKKRELLGQGFVTGWANLANGERVEIRETHEQRAYSEREIVAALGDAGLVPAEVIDFDPFHESDVLDAAGVKLFFICRLQ